MEQGNLSFNRSVSSFWPPAEPVAFWNLLSSGPIIFLFPILYHLWRINDNCIISVITSFYICNDLCFSGTHSCCNLLSYNWLVSFTSTIALKRHFISKCSSDIVFSTQISTSIGRAHLSHCFLFCVGHSQKMPCCFKFLRNDLIVLSTLACYSHK